MTDPTLEVRLSPDHAARALRHDVVTGLGGEVKWLPPKWFYDARGSELFDEITRLPEYYPTRAERGILDRRARELAARTTARSLVELGSGFSEKSRLLLDSLRAQGTLETFVPLDVSESALREAVDAIVADYPGLRVHAVVGDFTEPLSGLPGGTPRLVAFLGGTIGNLLPDEREVFLRSVRGVLDSGEWLLLGTDLVKDPAMLVRAYDDAAGVTAEFNLNVLRVLNRELGATFPVEDFSHVARWDAENEWIEMRLRAERALRVEIPGVDMVVDLGAGEEIRTEISAKFRREGVERELKAAGFGLDLWWTDRQERFALSLAQAL